MKIEIEKEDFVRLAVYASCADLPEKENKYKTTFTRIMDSLDKEDANAIAVHGIYALTTQHMQGSMKQRLMSPRLSRKATETGRWL